MPTLSNFTTTYDPASSVSIFGTMPPQLGVYPNDAILLDIYNFTNDYLETVFRASNYSRQDYTISIDVEAALRNQSYLSGRYNVTAKFLRNYLGSADGDKLVIQEVSTDRLEIRVTPVRTLENVNNNLEDFFQFGFFQVDKKEVLPNLYVFKDNFTYFKVFDYVQDPFTFPNAPFSIIFKLTSPLPPDLQVDDLIWIAQEVSQPIKDGVTVIPPARQLNVTTIAGPNFDIATQNTTNNVSDYKDWNDVLSTNTDTSLSVINKLFSGSLIEGVELNIDFRRFENFIHFGSAEERLRNFQYKMELLEYYDSRIYTLSQSYNGSGNSALTASAEYVANVLDAKTKKNALLGGFDTYEKYIFYESSSYVTNSFGEFYPTTWPKQNSSKPYVNYSVTSSEAQSWFNGIVSSASMYDLNNMNSLRKMVPEHVYVDPSNDQYILFIDMIGHYFDLIYAYVNQLTYINKRYESLTEGFAKDLVYSVGQSLGLNAENGAVLNDLWSYFLGTTREGALQSPTYAASVEDRTKEVWKRIIANLPYLLKTKGTARGIRALINCYGIPSTILRVREFGGPEPTYFSATQEEYDQFYYGLYLSGSSTSVSVPGYGSAPKALEVRFRLHSSSFTSNTDFTILTGPTTITANPVAGTVIVDGLTISNVPLTELDTDWWTVLANDGGRAYVGTNKYGTALIYSSSTAVSLASSTATIPGASNRLNGYINEYRLWSQNLDLGVYENHILAPTSFQGPQDDLLVGSTSSFETLKVRHTFGADGKKWDISATSSMASSHPDQQTGATTATFSGFGSNTASYWIPQTETHYLEVVDGGPTRKVGNKIRIETAIVSSSNQVQTNSSILDSLQDLQPVDSPRVGVYFSPTDEVDEDINEQFGGLNLDDYIGDPEDYYRDEYSRLARTRHNYFKKYQKRNNTQGFIRLIQNYDSSLFQLVKQFVPERALLHTGLVVESHVLHRNKIANKQPSYENLYWTSSINIFDDVYSGSYDTYEGTINGFDDTHGGTYDTYEGATEPVVETSITSVTDNNIVDSNAINTALVYTTTGAAIEYNNDDVLELTDTVISRDAEGAQYSYYTWFQTGSGDNDWVYAEGVSEDIWNPIQPVVLQNTLSDIYTTAIDRFNGRFTTNYLNFCTLYGIATRGLLESYGMSTVTGAGTKSFSVVELNGESVLLCSNNNTIPS
jgi:hypothetical protein